MTDIMKIGVLLSNFEGQKSVTPNEVIDAAAMQIEEDGFRAGQKESKTMTETNVDKLKRLEQELVEVRENIEKETKPKVWRPEAGEGYYYLLPHGEARWDRNHHCTVDKERLNRGNAYKTKEEVEKADKKQILLTKMRRLAAETNDPIDWGNWDQRKWFLQYTAGKWHMKCTDKFLIPGVIHFTNKYVLENFSEENRDDLHLLFEGEE